MMLDEIDTKLPLLEVHVATDEESGASSYEGTEQIERKREQRNRYENEIPSIKDTIIESVKFRLFFMFYSCRRSFVPLLSVLLRQRGFAPWQIGALRSGIHFPRFACRSLVTFVADYFQIRKTILILSILSWIVGFGAIIAVTPHEKWCGYTETLYSADASQNTTTHVDVGECQFRSRRQSANLSQPFPAKTAVTYNCTDLGSGITLNVSTTAMSPDKLDWLYSQSELWTIFVLYMAILVVAAPLQGVTNPLANAAIFDSLGRENKKYGWHKAFGGIGNIFG